MALLEEHWATNAGGSVSPHAVEARRRLLRLAFGLREEALEPIDDVSVDLQEFWRWELFGLACLLEKATGMPGDPRLAEAQTHLEEALQFLRTSCPLVVRNLAFVTDIQSYGVYTPFEKYEFEPGQRVLLYAEVQNFKSVSTPKGYYTASRSKFEIFNSEGQRVASHEFPTSEEYCRQYRRDFFLGYDFTLPRNLTAGKYLLRLVVEDGNSGRTGQSGIHFEIRPK